LILGAVLGGDVSKSRSPAIHNAAFRALGIAGKYEAMSVDAAAFDELVAQLGARGYQYLSVTIPHKAEAARIATTRSALVRTCGAANTLIFEPATDATAARDLRAIHAENTDGYGLIAALADLGAEPGGQDAVLVGGGGAASGAIEALTAAGARVRVVARRLEAAEALVRKLPESRRRLALPFAWADGGLGRALDGARMLVSSVPAAAWDDAAATADLAEIERDTAVLEMAYGAHGGRGSALAHAVRGRVGRYADGLGMLVHQAARAIELALGESPPLAPLFVAARTARL
jgi:shikimate dehydrogenase